MYDLCEVCGDRVVRDLRMVISGKPRYWLGVCSCATRRWRWKSETGVTPWTLIDGVNQTSAATTDG